MEKNVGKLEVYFDEMKNPPNPLNYPVDDIERHRKLMEEYFAKG